MLDHHKLFVASTNMYFVKENCVLIILPKKLICGFQVILESHKLRGSNITRKPQINFSVKTNNTEFSLYKRHNCRSHK